MPEQLKGQGDEKERERRRRKERSWSSGHRYSVIKIGPVKQKIHSI